MVFMYVDVHPFFWVDFREVFRFVPSFGGVAANFRQAILRSLRQTIWRPMRSFTSCRPKVLFPKRPEPSFWSLPSTISTWVCNLNVESWLTWVTIWVLKQFVFFDFKLEKSLVMWFVPFGTKRPILLKLHHLYCIGYLSIPWFICM